MLAAYFQADTLGCVLSGASDSVRPVQPCGHLVCRLCFDLAEYTACPICNRRLDPTDPYLVVPEPAPQTAGGRPVRLQRLDLGRGVATEATALRDVLAGRLAPLSDAERRDLRVLISATTQPGDLSWAPELPARETKAIVTAHALRTASELDRAETIRRVAASGGPPPTSPARCGR